MGRKLIITGVNFTDTTLPKIPLYDQIESDGSLILWEPGHSLSEVADGVVPSNGSANNNILWTKAQGMLPSGTKTTLAVSFSRSEDLANIWMLERTLKGAIHGIPTQAGGMVNGGQAYMSVNSPALIRDYIRSNLGHAFYFSSWRKVTRKGLSSGAPQSPAHLAENTSNFLFHMGDGGFTPGTNILLSPTTSEFDPSFVNGTNKFSAGAVTGLTGAPDVGTQLEWGIGTLGAWSSLNFNKAPSAVFYRFYAEDLTVSGRTFATVRDLDKALFDAAFAADGRYNGDTYTDPATLP